LRSDLEINKFKCLMGLSLAEEVPQLPYFGSNGGIERPQSITAT
jgi:hypothetical protein